MSLLHPPPSSLAMETCPGWAITDQRRNIKINNPHAHDTQNSHRSFPNVTSWYKSSHRETSSALLGWQSQARSCAFWSAIFWHLQCELVASLHGQSNLVTHRAVPGTRKEAGFLGFSSVSLKDSWSAEAYFFYFSIPSHPFGWRVPARASARSRASARGRCRLPAPAWEASVSWFIYPLCSHHGRIISVTCHILFTASPLKS